MLLLVQAGASPSRPPAEPTSSSRPARVPCLGHYLVVFVTDVSGLSSSAEADAFRGMTQALASIPCSQRVLVASRLPSDYVANLEQAALRRPDLVVAGSFLLTDAAVAAANANPGVHFVLVDPIVVPKAPTNLLIVTFRRNESAYLAGALAAMLTRTSVVAGVYGPGGADDRVERAGFERGALDARPGIRVLGAYQPADAGEPYNDPEWGAAQAHAFIVQGADVIFGAGAATGVGALSGATVDGRSCIGSELPGAAAPPCLVATTRVWLDRGTALAIQRLHQQWQSGVLSLGLAQDAVGLETAPVEISADIQNRLVRLQQRLVDGGLHPGA